MSRGLAEACERALVVGARSAGTRQQVRAAARGFIRRHRRDARFLAWVLRSVTASSALAVALLGLSAAPAGAALAPFVVAGSNPLVGQDAGVGSTAVLGDLDGDGDLDIVAGESNGTFLYLANTGSAEAPAFAVAANPLSGQDVGLASNPALGDLDGDGDLDLVAGEKSGVFRYFENTGSATSPGFVERTGLANPLHGEALAYYTSPTIGDFDDDGDLDVVVGGSFGRFLYLQNAGGATDPDFTRRTGSLNPLDGVDVGDRAAPATADLDGDGDADLVTGSLAGTFAVHYFPEPARGLLLGAGMALLGLLAGSRRDPR